MQQSKRVMAAGRENPRSYTERRADYLVGLQTTDTDTSYAYGSIRQPYITRSVSGKSKSRKTRTDDHPNGTGFEDVEIEGVEIEDVEIERPKYHKRSQDRERRVCESAKLFHLTDLKMPKHNFNSRTVRKPRYTTVQIRLIQHTFENLCKEGTIEEIAELLYSDKGQMIDIHKNNEEPFINACVDNTLEVVEFLYNAIHPNLAADNHGAFRMAALTNRIEIVQFLSCHNESYSVTIVDGVIDQSSVVFGTPKKSYEKLYQEHADELDELMDEIEREEADDEDDDEDDDEEYVDDEDDWGDDWDCKEEEGEESE